jgi:myo-inositol-1(or 4)-monophosphatase
MTVSLNEPPDAALLADLELMAARWAREAGDLLLTRFRTKLIVEYKSKGQADPVTDADRAAEAFLRDAIRARYPKHGVLGEEGTEPPPDAPFVWVLDPLDGTTNFINGLPLWCVSIGVLWRNRPVAAAIFTPSGPTAAPGVFHAHAGGGAFLDALPLHVSPEPEPAKARLSGLPGHYWEEMRFRKRKPPQLGETRTLGSMALELGLIGAGVLQYGVFWGPKIWDVAGGVLIVSEAGGDVVWRCERSEPWSRLHAFTPPAGAGGLRGWKGSVIAGTPGVVNLISEDVEARHTLLSPLGPLWKRLTEGDHEQDNGKHEVL